MAAVLVSAARPPSQARCGSGSFSPKQPPVSCTVTNTPPRSSMLAATLRAAWKAARLTDPACSGSDTGASPLSRIAPHASRSGMSPAVAVIPCASSCATTAGASPLPPSTTPEPGRVASPGHQGGESHDGDRHLARTTVGLHIPPAVARWTPTVSAQPARNERESMGAANKTLPIRAWAENHKVHLCFTPTSASWANPIEAQFGPLRTFVMGGSNHPNHTVLARRLQDYLTWRTPTPAILTSWPRSAPNAPASAANASNAGDAPGHGPHDQPGARSWTPH